MPKRFSLVFFWRRFLIAWAILFTGILPNHLSCSNLVQDSVAGGVSDFLSRATSELLTQMLFPGGLDGGGNGSNDGDGDPFEPPIQG